MSPVDIIIIIILLWGAYRGWKAGLVKEVLSTCGFIVGLIAAALLYKTVGAHLTPALGSGSVASYAGCVLAFILIWVVVPIIFGMVANVITKTAKALFLGPVNKLLGMIVGVAKYFVLISFVFYGMAYVGIISPKKREASKFFPYITIVGQRVLGDKIVAEERADNEEKTVIIHFDRDNNKKNAGEGRE